MAKGLAKAHSLGITHRDLKPSNVMLTKTGAKLMDFGLAKELDLAQLAAATELTADETKLTSRGMIVGTFQYMAPEQLEGKEADARTDVFALGEVIYEMATGKAAFSGKSRASLIAAILTAVTLAADCCTCATIPSWRSHLIRQLALCTAMQNDWRRMCW
jgi:eukaryotic-like serine/threonine-protein kinase